MFAMVQKSISHWFNQPFYTKPIKALLISLILLLCLFPLQQLKNTLNQELNQEQLQAQQFKTTWGKNQQVIGPLLIIPYTDHVTSVDTVTEGNGESKVLSKDVYNDYTAVILPTTLDIRVDLNEATESQAKQASAYKANVSLNGRFDYGYLLAESAEGRTIHWDKAVLTLAISDTRALVKSTAMQWNYEKIFLQPGNTLKQLAANGLHVPLAKLDAKDSLHEFKIDLLLQGSEQFLLAPVGETTTAHMSSSFEAPSFQHSLKPNKQEQNNLGFKAHWEVSNLARSYPQTWLLEDKANYDFTAVNLGMTLPELKSNEAQLLSLVNYAPWVLLISLAILFSFELIQQQSLNLLQYLLFASTQVLFFALLFAINHELALRTSYLISAISCLFISFIHSTLIFKSFFQGLLVTTLMTGLYYVLYLALTADSQLLAAASVYGLALSMLGLIVAWSLVPDSARSLRSDEEPEQEENTHI
jgi:inner membrane protein